MLNTHPNFEQIFFQIIYNRGQLCHKKCKEGNGIFPCLFGKTSSLGPLKESTLILAFWRAWEEDFSKWQADQPRLKDSPNVTSCKHSQKITSPGQLFLLLYLTWFKCCGCGGAGGGRLWWAILLVEIYLGEYNLNIGFQP